MNLRKLRTAKQDEQSEEQEEKKVEKPKRTRIKNKEERGKNPLSGALALAVLAGIGILFLVTTLFNSEPQVQGVRTQKEKEAIEEQASDAASSIRERVDERLESIKERVADLSPEDATENAPQITKLIEDLQALQGMPQESVENACHAVCDAIDQRE